MPVGQAACPEIWLPQLLTMLRILPRLTAQAPCLPGRGRPAPITVGLPWVAASSLISMEVKNEMLTPPSSSGLWDILDIWGPWEAHDGHRWRRKQLWGRPVRVCGRDLQLPGWV